jgi:Flp pilus assembly protein TadD
MDREFTPAVQALGSLLLESGRDDEAEELLLTAANASPPNSDACFNLGTLSQSRGKLGEAEQWYMRALANDKNHLQAHNALGMLLFFASKRPLQSSLTTGRLK